MKTNFFSLLLANILPGMDILSMNISKSDENIIVSIIPRYDIKDEVKDKIVPIILTAPVSEMDEKFFSEIKEPIQRINTRFSNIAEFEKSTEKAVSKSATTKKIEAKLDQGTLANHKKAKTLANRLATTLSGKTFEKLNIVKLNGLLEKIDEITKLNPKETMISDLEKKIQHRISEIQEKEEPKLFHIPEEPKAETTPKTDTEPIEVSQEKAAKIGNKVHQDLEKELNESPDIVEQSTPEEPSTPVIFNEDEF